MNDASLSTIAEPTAPVAVQLSFPNTAERSKFLTSVDHRYQRSLFDVILPYLSQLLNLGANTEFRFLNNERNRKDGDPGVEGFFFARVYFNLVVRMGLRGGPLVRIRVNPGTTRPDGYDSEAFAKDLTDAIASLSVDYPNAFMLPTTPDAKKGARATPPTPPTPASPLEPSVRPAPPPPVASPLVPMVEEVVEVVVDVVPAPEVAVGVAAVVEQPAAAEASAEEDDSAAEVEEIQISCGVDGYQWHPRLTYVTMRTFALVRALAQKDDFPARQIEFRDHIKEELGIALDPVLLANTLTGLLTGGYTEFVRHDVEGKKKLLVITVTEKGLKKAGSYLVSEGGVEKLPLVLSSGEDVARPHKKAALEPAKAAVTVPLAPKDERLAQTLASATANVQHLGVVHRQLVALRAERKEVIAALAEEAKQLAARRKAAFNEVDQKIRRAETELQAAIEACAQGLDVKTENS